MTSEQSWLASDLYVPHEELLDTSAIHRGVVGSYLSPFYRIGRLYRARIGGRRALRESALLLPEILATIEHGDSALSTGSWTVLRAAWSLTDVAVVILGPRDESPQAIVKLPHTTEGMAHLRRQRKVLETLQTHEKLGSFRQLVPSPLAEGVIDGQLYLVESVRPGTELRAFDTDSDAYFRGLNAAADCISVLHRVTGTPRSVGEADLERWVDMPLRLIEGLLGLLPRSTRADGVVQEIRRDLSDALADYTQTTSWIHGDFWPGNILVAPDGAVVQGIVDWGRGAPDELPMHDLMQLVMHSPRLLRTNADLGTTVQALLRNPVLEPEELQLLAGAPALPVTDSNNLRRMILLYWIRYLSSYLAKCPDKVRNQWWIKRNVADVFRAL